MTPEHETEMLGYLKTIAETLEHLMQYIQVAGQTKFQIPAVQSPAQLRQQQQQRRHRP
jgi:hypothetical protein